MVYIFGSLLFVVLAVFTMRKIGVDEVYAKGTLLLLVLSLLANIVLSQNYTQSLIPGVSDGIAISNQITYWIIGEDGWSQEHFQKAFKVSMVFSFVFVVAYVVAILLEKIRKR